MHNILVLGGTGFIGRSVCERLVERSGGGGGRIVVPSRHPARAKHVQLLPTVQVQRADVHDPRQLAALVAGSDAVINLVARLHGSEAEFQRAHVELPRNLAAACQAQGVRRLVHVSALGASASAPSRYLRSKAAGEAVLREAGLDLTLLRPTVVFGEHDRFLNVFASLLAMAPLLPLAGASTRFQPVWVEDVARAIVACLDDPTTIGQTIECAGPTVYTLAELVRLAGRWSGHVRPVIGMPLAVGKLQAGLLELLPGDPLMSRDNVDSLRLDSVASGQWPGLERLGIVPAPLETVAPRYLGGLGGPGRLDPWRARHKR